MSEQLGEPISFGDHVVHAFPPPQTLAGLDGFGGLSARKPEWLRSLARAVALAYRLPEPPADAELLELSQRWRPYRTWVTLLLRTQLEDETGEISGRNT
jgi:3-methyladenine DNA glycosylase/8-oxoguanine DNA glycosylase